MLLIPAAGIHAGDAPLSLGKDAAVARSLVANKHLRAAEMELHRARIELYWEGRLDNPELDLSAAHDVLGNAEGEANFEIAFAQKFPLTSRLRSARELRRVQVILAEAEINGRRRKLANQVRIACVEFAAANQKASLYSRLTVLNEEIATFLSAIADRGEASQLDAAGARLAGKKLAREANAALIESRKWLGELRSLLGLKPDAALALNVDLTLPASPPPFRDNLASAVIQRPDYQASLIESNVARAELNLAEARSLADLTVKLFAERERSYDNPDGLDNNTLIGLGFSFPLPLRKRNQAAIESSRTKIARRKLETDAIALKIENEIAIALVTRKDTFEAARDASGKVLQLAESNLQGYREAYSAGQASFTQVQRAQEQKLELEKAALELTREYHLAELALKFATAADTYSSGSETPSKPNPAKNNQ